jgi:hypothetical protein
MLYNRSGAEWASAGVPSPEIRSLAMRDITERFKVRRADGTIDDAMILRDRIYDTDLGSTTKTFHHGMPEARLADGRAMNRVDDDTFEIFDTKERVTRVR